MKIFNVNQQAQVKRTFAISNTQTSVLKKISWCFFLLSFNLGLSVASAAELIIPPDGPDQMPIIYVHGVNSDGASWGVGPPGKFASNTLASRYLYTKTSGPARSPSRFFEQLGIPNWAVQWQAIGGDSPYASESEGRAFLQTAEELRAGVDWVAGTWTAQNHPVPGLLDVLLSFHTFAVDTTHLPIPVFEFEKVISIKATNAIVAAQLPSIPNYQSAGRIDPRAANFVSMLADERTNTGKLADYRQVNIITHSMGSLVTRAMLDKAKVKSRQDSEFIANVIYNAPPFAGSTMSYMSNLLFESPQVTRDVFNDPMVRRLVEVHPTAADSISDVIDIIIAPTYSKAGLSHDVFYALLPAGSLVDLLVLQNINLGESGVGILDFLAQDEFWGGLAVDFMNNGLRFVLSSMNGLPGMKEFDPAGGAVHLTRYENNEDVKQFVTIGNGGGRINLFPASLPDVVNTPDILFDIQSLFASEDDIGLAVGSAKLLTTTDKFGPAMTLLSPFNSNTGVFEGLTHEELLTENVPAMAPVWLQTLWVPPTSLVLDGDAIEIDSAQRRYVVKDVDTLMSFDSVAFDKPLTFSSPFPPVQQKSVVVNIAAASHEYRVIIDDGSGTAPSEWKSVVLGNSVSFRRIRDVNGLANKPFFLEWRSINEAGGREMIRSARFTVLGDIPQIASYRVLAANPAEVIKLADYISQNPNATRSDNLTSVIAANAEQAARLAAVLSQPESIWMLRNPQNKGITLVLDSIGDIEYAWDDNGLANPTKVSGVSGALIEMGALTDGQHNLYIRLSASVSGVVKASDIIRLGVSVDNTPPVINFSQASTHPLGVIAGLRTPLIFSVHDVDSNAASGEAQIAGLSQWSYPDGKIFTLNQPDLIADLQAKGIVGGFIDVVFNATDALGNKSQSIQQLYLDITPPELEVVDVIGALPAQNNNYNSATDSVQLLMNVSDQGAGFSSSPQLTVQYANGETGQRNDLILGFINGNPDRYGMNIKLQAGINKVLITAQDIAGNVSNAEFEINYRAIETPGDVDIVSPRLQTCFNADGSIEVNCGSLGAIGSIQDIASSYHGETVAFSSGGRQFVHGDYNKEQDVFVYRNGLVSLVSENAAGEQGDDRSEFPQVSGNGRYVIFQSTATNLAPNTERSGNLPQHNLFIKDLQTNRIAVITRRANQLPANVTGGSVNYYPAVTFSARYVFFSSKRNIFVDGITSPDNYEKIYMVDLDPDENGDLFDDNYQNHAVTLETSTTQLSGKMLNPHVSQNGRYLVFSTGVNSLTAVQGVMLFKFVGNEADGTLDVSQRSTVFIGEGSRARISPLGDSVAFTSIKNLTADDTNQEINNSDVYLSSGETAGASFSNRTLSLLSGEFNGAGTVGKSMSDLSVSEDRPAGVGAVKVSWISRYNNLVANDSNGVDDLFMSRQSAVFPSGLEVTNWISGDVPSAAASSVGLLVPSGRYALWASRQVYINPFSATGRNQIYKRRIDPADESILEVSVVGEGQVLRSPPGTDQGADRYAYDDEQQVVLSAQSTANSTFIGWSGTGITGIDSQQASLSLSLHDSQRLIARFQTVIPPAFASAELTTLAGVESKGVAPLIEAKSGQTFQLSIVANAENGQARVSNGFLYYKPNPGFAGNDKFSFQVSNQFNQSLSMPAIALVTVLAVNQSPVSAELIISTEQDTQSQVTLPSVVDSTVNEQFTYRILLTAQKGVVSLQADGFVYTPIANYVGEDSFQFQVIDSAENKISATAQITVTKKADNNTGGTATAGKSSGGGLGIFMLGLFLLTRWLYFYTANCCRN